MTKMAVGLCAGFLTVIVGAMIVFVFWLLDVAVGGNAFDVGSFIAGAFSGAVGIMLGAQVSGALFKL